MIEKIWVSAHNCCPIEECHAECLLLGHPTWLGFIIMVMGIIILIVGSSYLRLVLESKHFEGD